MSLAESVRGRSCPALPPGTRTRGQPALALSGRRAWAGPGLPWSPREAGPSAPASLWGHSAVRLILRSRGGLLMVELGGHEAAAGPASTARLLPARLPTWPSRGWRTAASPPPEALSAARRGQRRGRLSGRRTARLRRGGLARGVGASVCRDTDARGPSGLGGRGARHFRQRPHLAAGRGEAVGLVSDGSQRAGCRQPNQRGAERPRRQDPPRRRHTRGERGPDVRRAASGSASQRGRPAHEPPRLGCPSRGLISAVTLTVTTFQPAKQMKPVLAGSGARALSLFTTRREVRPRVLPGHDPALRSAGGPCTPGHARRPLHPRAYLSTYLTLSRREVSNVPSQIL